MSIDSRYVKQARFVPLGTDGQEELSHRRVFICGCGALGSVLAETLARAGVGHLRLADRDFVELTNLHRQVLFDEQDVRDEVPKAIAAERRLRQINSSVDVEAHVCDVSSTNIETLLEGVDCICDGTDNFETRFLLNDAAHRFGIPWVYGGCIGAEGQQMTIVPGVTPCLRCLMHDVPPPGTTPTCDTVGVLGPIVNVIASVQAIEAMKILSGKQEAISRTLNVFDLWDSRIRQIETSQLNASETCPTCSLAQYPWLEGTKGSHTAVLCGRNAVQLSFPNTTTISLEKLAEELSTIGPTRSNQYLVRAELGRFTLTVFRDGRAIVAGTEDAAEAKTVYAQYVGL